MREKKLTLQEIIGLVIMFCFLIQSIFIIKIAFSLDNISTNFDNIIGHSNCNGRKRCSNSYRLQIDGSVGASVEGSISVDNVYGNSFRIE